MIKKERAKERMCEESRKRRKAKKQTRKQE